MRLIDIMCNLPHRLKLHKPTSLPISKKSLLYESLKHQSMHDCYENGLKLRCLKCSGSVFRSGASTIKWLSQQCCEESPALAKPIVRNNRTITVNGRESHSSHDLRTYNELVYCHKCGYTAKNKLVGLVQPCAPATAYCLKVFELK